MILLPLVGGSIITLFTINAQETFGNFNQPPLAPPAWLFPVMWTILYIMMGVASYLIYRVKAKKPAEKKLKTAELVLFYVQLLFNFAWTLIFFNLDVKYFAFGWLIVMWLMILALMIMCGRNCKKAMWLLLPYLLWCTFAAYLNISIAILN
ncbi:tryptophan-rich sensory protein [Candidatus Saccharibacteria bacterium]|nr:tryptophan-rich sensory protein [Candidatus Saccharibacteria bacterium]